jgi:hypothetical protein
VRRLVLVLLVLLVLALSAGGTAVVLTLSERKKRNAKLLRDAFERRGLPPAWGEALGRHESGLNDQATNLEGPDGARGGSFGMTQISERTAQAFDVALSGAMLLASPQLQADVTAAMVAAGFAERGGKTYRYGPPASIEQMAAVWNAGRLYTDPQLPASVTKSKTGYIAKLRGALAAAEATA